MVHPLPCGNANLMGLKDDLPMWGIAYKDRPENAAGFLKHSGNPFTRLGSDRDGRVGIDWGISGVPETFLIGPGGIIRWHSAAPLDVDTIRGTLAPLLESLKNHDAAPPPRPVSRLCAAAGASLSSGGG